MSDDEDTKTETPELSDEGKEQCEQMQAAYADDRQTAVLPGTDGTITGVAINEWLDDDGNPKFGKEKQEEREKEDAEKEDARGESEQEDAKGESEQEDAKGESEREDARGESEQHAEKAEK